MAIKIKMVHKMRIKKNDDSILIEWHQNFFSEGVRTNHDMARKLLSHSVSDLTNMQINCYKGDYRQPPMTKTNLMNATRMSLEMHEMAEMSLTLPEREFQ